MMGHTFRGWLPLAAKHTMQKVMPKYGIELVEIPRVESGDAAISASRVRAVLTESEDLDSLAALLPDTTLAYLKSQRGSDVIRKLREMKK